MTNLILTAAWKGIVVLGVAWSATALLRRRSADLRHRIWLAALIAMALLMVPFSLPQTLRMTHRCAAPLRMGPWRLRRARCLRSRSFGL